MTNENLLDQTICKLPFEVLLQQNSNSSLNSPINVKVRIRNKKDAETGKYGIISVPKRTAKNFPKRMRLGNSSQTIMSFKLALEPNTDDSKKTSNRRLFQMFKPGRCLSSHSDEDGYPYMPSTSNDLKRKSASSIDHYENNQITGTFALKKNDFSPSYTNTLKSPKTFLGKCKPGGCLDPPFSEDKYTYNPTAKDAQTVEQPTITRNSLHPEINTIEPKSASQNQQINIFHSYGETEVLGKTAMLVTYPTTLSSTNFKTKDSKNNKSSLRMQSEQIEVSRNVTNEFSEVYFIPPRQEKPKYDKTYDKHNYKEKEPKIKEAYVNKDYIMQSQTPSELLSDELTITSQSLEEPLQENQNIRELNPVIPSIMKSVDVLNDKTSKDKIKSTSVSVESIIIDDMTSSQKQSPFYHNNIPIIENIYSIATESKKELYKDINRLNSTNTVNVSQENNEDINYEKNDVPNSDQNQSILYNSNSRNHISSKTSKHSKDLTSASLNNFEIIEEHKFLRKHSNVINNKISEAEITDKKQQIGVRSEEIMNPVKDTSQKKGDTLENGYMKQISGQVISTVIIEDTNGESNRKSLITVQSRDNDKIKNLDKNGNEHFINISESTKVLAQNFELTDNDNVEELIEDKTKRATEEINYIHPVVVSDLIPKVSSLHSLDEVLSPEESHILVSPKNIYLNPKDSLLGIENSISTRISNEINNADKRNGEHNQSLNTLENMLLTSSPKTEINAINTGLNRTSTSRERKHDITSMSDRLGSDTIIIPEIHELDSLFRKEIELDNPNTRKLERELSIKSQIKPSKDTVESTETISHLNKNFTDFDSLKFRQSLNSKMILSDIDILSDDKFRKTASELNQNIKSPNTIFYKTSEKDIDKLENKEADFLSNKIGITYPREKFELQENDMSITEKQNFDKSESDFEVSEKKSSQKFHNVQKLKKIDETTVIKKPIEDSEKNINSISSIAINFGFHKFTNEKTGYSIKTFDPSINLASYPQNKIVTVKTILRSNDSKINIHIDSETDLTMQINSKQGGGSTKLTSNVLNGSANSKEMLINKDKLLQPTLKAIYETLLLIENNIIKLKEEADSLYHEQLLVKEVLLSKEIKPIRIIPNVKTCSCLQKEIGLE